MYGVIKAHSKRHVIGMYIPCRPVISQLVSVAFPVAGGEPGYGWLRRSIYQTSDWEFPPWRGRPRPVEWEESVEWDVPCPAVVYTINFEFQIIPKTQCCPLVRQSLWPLKVKLSVGFHSVDPFLRLK